MAEFRMPSLGADMQAGTLVAWKVRSGDAVERGQVIADVETDKGIIEVEIWQSGTVDALLVAPGTRVPVGTVLATLHGPGEEHDAVAADEASVRATEPDPVPSPHVAERASPAARRRARELGVDLAGLSGTGPHGTIRLQDVERALGAAPAAAGAAPDRMRGAIAAAMARSKREIPHYYLSTSIDLHRAMGWLEEDNARRSVGDRLLPAALLLRAVARAAVRVPDVNGLYRDGAFFPSRAVHLGVAIALRGGGLVAPALFDVEHKDVGAIMRELGDLVVRARAGTLRSREMTEATLTVTNLGELGADAAFPVIVPPQVAIVGFGRIASRPWAVDGMLAVRPIVVASLGADHRVSDGHRGARFLAALDDALQDPEERA